MTDEPKKDARFYHAEIDIPLTGSVRQERAQIEALPGLEDLEAAIGKIDGATFRDGVVRRTGKRVLAGVTQPKKPGKPAA
jgi:hypothetical protein